MTATWLNHFNCRQLPDVEVLKADYDIKCYDDFTWWILAAISAAGLLLVSLGVPCGMLYVMWKDWNKEMQMAMNKQMQAPGLVLEAKISQFELPSSTKEHQAELHKEYLEQLSEQLNASMSVKALMQRAKDVGVGDEQLASALDADGRVKAEIIQRIKEKKKQDRAHAAQFENGVRQGLKEALKNGPETVITIDLSLIHI